MTKFALRLYSFGDERHDKRHNDFHSNTKIKNLCVTCLFIKSPREKGKLFCCRCSLENVLSALVSC